MTSMFGYKMANSRKIDKGCVDKVNFIINNELEI